MSCDFKICDFGFVRMLIEIDMMIEYVVIRWYCVLELFFNCLEYIGFIDIWFVGCIFMEIFRREMFFFGKDYV